MYQKFRAALTSQPVTPGPTIAEARTGRALHATNDVRRDDLQSAADFGKGVKPQ